MSRTSPPTTTPCSSDARATCESCGEPALTMRAAASCEAPIFRPTSFLGAVPAVFVRDGLLGRAAFGAFWAFGAFGAEKRVRPSLMSFFRNEVFFSAGARFGSAGAVG
jgi:hypothetical protein